MEEEKKKRRRWRDIPLATKMILAVGSIMVMMLVINMILYEQVNTGGTSFRSRDHWLVNGLKYVR